MDRIAAVNDQLNVPVATEQRKGKCTEDGSAVTGRAIPHVSTCHPYTFAQPQLPVLSLPDQKAKKVWS